MQRAVIVCIILISFLQVSGQQVLISEDLRGDTAMPVFGMNRKHFGHFFLGLYKVAGTSELHSDELNAWRSWAFELGYRYKRKFSHVFSAGVDLSAQKMSYSINHWAMINTPETNEADKHKLIFLQSGLSVYQRFNYDKRRGDYVGKYIDVGAYGDWNFNTRQVYHYKSNEGENVRTRKGNLGYIYPFEWGLLMRVGFNKIAAKATCRFSDHFKETSGIGEMPRCTIGVEVGLFSF